MNNRSTVVLIFLAATASLVVRSEAAPKSSPSVAAPAQSSVAVHTAFAMVAASAPIVKKALSARDLAGAQKMVGKPAAFQGTVSKVFSPKGNKLVILDFAPEYKSAVTAVAMPGAYAKLPDLKTLEGKHVLVSGKFVAFHGAPQIELTGPAQVKIIH